MKYSLPLIALGSALAFFSCSENSGNNPGITSVEQDIQLMASTITTLSLPNGTGAKEQPLTKRLARQQVSMEKNLEYSCKWVVDFEVCSDGVDTDSTWYFDSTGALLNEEAFIANDWDAPKQYSHSISSNSIYTSDLFDTTTSSMSGNLFDSTSSFNFKMEMVGWGKVTYKVNQLELVLERMKVEFDTETDSFSLNYKLSIMKNKYMANFIFAESFTSMMENENVALMNLESDLILKSTGEVVGSMILMIDGSVQFKDKDGLVITP